ncbi:MAG: ADOP family duplicated permease [Gemmatimonadota bacterium]
MSVQRDVSYALRMLRREPTFVAGVVLTFALTIGTTAAMFGLVTRLMLAPPPGIRAPERVARAGFSVAGVGGEPFGMTTTSYPTFRALAAATNAFTSVAASRSDSMLVGRSPELTPLAVLGASGEYFITLGPHAIAGRFFGLDDDVPPLGNAVVVLSYNYWQLTYDGDRSIVGQQIVIEDQPYTILGIAPPGFNGDGLAPIDVFMPLSASLRGNTSNWISTRGMNIISVVARLRDGVSVPAASQMASGVVQDDASTAGSTSLRVELEPVLPGLASRQAPQAQIALWLAAVSLIVLLIATANVGTLLSLRAARRRREVAVRIALGASRGQLTRQFLTESMLLAVIGATMGLVLSRWFADVMRVLLLPNLAPSERFVDSRVLAASVAAACLAGVVAGLVPLSQTRSVSLSSQLRAGGHGSSSRLALQNTLVTIQVALCTVLLVGASLFVRSLQRVQSQNLGFSTQQLLYVTLDFRDYTSAPERDMTYMEAVDRLRSVPSLNGATVAAGIPFGPHNIPPVSVPGMPWPPQDYQIPIMYGTTPEYLKLMDVQLIRGRLTTGRDRRGAPLTVLVNESMARTLWPGESALGKCVRAGFGAGFPPADDGTNPADGAPCREVVGVVADSRARSLRPERKEDRIMQYYVPFEQLPDSPMPDQPSVMGLILRARGDLSSARVLVQNTIQSSSAVRVFAKVRPYQELIDPQLRSWRLGASLFSAFSALALAIAAVGLFGVISYIVTQRTNEIGVRLALGGTAPVVTRMIVRDSLRLVGLGIGIGVLAAVCAGPLIEGMLFQTSSREPLSIAMAGGILVLTTLLAAGWPALAAGRVDPVVALRTEG